jgi:hypothetical protein
MKTEEERLVFFRCLCSGLAVRARRAVLRRAPRPLYSGARAEKRAIAEVRSEPGRVNCPWIKGRHAPGLHIPRTRAPGCARASGLSEGTVGPVGVDTASPCAEGAGRALLLRRRRADRPVGQYLAEELPAIYAEQAAAVVVFVSAEYAAGNLTRHERRAALGRAVRERREYVLPTRFDDTALPRLLSDLVEVDLRGRTPQQFAAMIGAKLATLGVTSADSAVSLAGDAGMARLGGRCRPVRRTWAGRLPCGCPGCSRSGVTCTGPRRPCAPGPTPVTRRPPGGWPSCRLSRTSRERKLPAPEGGVPRHGEGYAEPAAHHPRRRGHGKTPADSFNPAVRGTTRGEDMRSGVISHPLMAMRVIASRPWRDSPARRLSVTVGRGIRQAVVGAVVRVRVNCLRRLAAYRLRKPNYAQPRDLRALPPRRVALLVTARLTAAIR